MRQCPRCLRIGDDTEAFCPLDGTALADLPTPSSSEEALVGQDLGHYRVAKLLGSGGMGSVYLATHPRIGSRVAIKLLHRETAHDPELVRRFFAEARVVNLIRHENIVDILDFAELPDGRSYLVMEYLDGVSLSQHLRSEGPLPAAKAVAVMRAVLAALQAAHDHGVVHRDLKPDNVHLASSGRVKVLDFGIAKLDPSISGVISTRAGAILGTPAYMSPEQATGRTEAIDARTDVWAAGVMLFELLTGRPPIQASTFAELVSRIVTEPSPTLRSVRSDLPAGLEAAIARALEKAPERRFATAAEMAAALEHALAPEASVPGPLQAGVPPTAARRGRSVAVSAGVVAAVVVVAAGALLVQSRGGAPRGPTSVASPVRGLTAAAGAGGAPARASGTGALPRGADTPPAGAAAGAIPGDASRAELDARLRAEGEPPPPPDCQAAPDSLALCLQAATLLAGGEPRAARPADTRALELLEAAPPAARTGAEYWFLRGKAELGLGRIEAASVSARAATQRCDGFAAAHNLAGIAAFLAGKDDAASRAFARAEALDATYAKPLVNRALVLLKQQRANDALALLDRALALAPEDPGALRARGSAALFAGAPARAIPDLQAATRLAPGDGQAQLLLGKAYREVGRAEDASACFCRAKELGNELGARLCPAEPGLTGSAGEPTLRVRPDRTRPARSPAVP